MAETSIEWTQRTWNPVVGCEAISPGCKNCYAATMTRRLESMGQADYSGLTTKKHFNGVVRCLPGKLDIPLKRRKPTTYFVNSMSDLFHEDVPFDFIDKVFAVMNATAFKLPIPADLNVKPWHTYQVLTKRAERMCEYMNSRSTKNFAKCGSHPIFSAGRSDGGALRGYGSDVMNAGAVLQWPPPNVWLGVSCEDQQRAHERISRLLKTPAAVRFLSCEPLLGPIDLGLRNWADIPREDCRLDWVIVGGESGHGARPCNVEWVRSIVAQCEAADVPCFVKQLGAAPRDILQNISGWPNWRDRIHQITDAGERSEVYANLASKKGGDIGEWPEDLRVRQFPSEVPHG